MTVPGLAPNANLASAPINIDAYVLLALVCGAKSIEE